jgi:amyloid beta precursor protein binding protein 1
VRGSAIGLISDRFERRFRLWAASGQAALESSKVLVISASATSTSILKNLVLPGIGQFTIIDDKATTPEDAGNNFFLNGHHSIGKLRAEEAVACLRELNDGVEGISDTSNFERRFNADPSFLAAYTIVIAHNLHPTLLDKVAEFLWTDPLLPTLIVVRSAGFLAEFFIQFHEHHGGSEIQSYMHIFSSTFSYRVSLRKHAITSD